MCEASDTLPGMGKALRWWSTAWGRGEGEVTGSLLEKVRGEGGRKHCASTGRCHNGTVKTSLSIYSCLPHHRFPWGDLCTLGLQQARSAKAFGAVTALLSPYPAPAEGFCTCSTGNQRLCPAESGTKPSLPHPAQSQWVSPWVLMVFRSASCTREWWAEGRTGRREVEVW